MVFPERAEGTKFLLRKFQNNEEKPLGTTTAQTHKSRDPQQQRPTAAETHNDNRDHHQQRPTTAETHNDSRDHHQQRPTTAETMTNRDPQQQQRPPPTETHNRDPQQQRDSQQQQKPPPTETHNNTYPQQRLTTPLPIQTRTNRQCTEKARSPWDRPCYTTLLLIFHSYYPKDRQEGNRGSVGKLEGQRIIWEEMSGIEG